MPNSDDFAILKWWIVKGDAIRISLERPSQNSPAKAIALGKACGAKGTTILTGRMNPISIPPSRLILSSIAAAQSRAVPSSAEFHDIVFTTAMNE